MTPLFKFICCWFEELYSFSLKVFIWSIGAGPLLPNILYRSQNCTKRNFWKMGSFFLEKKKNTNFLDKNTVAKISLLEMVERTLFRKWKDDQIRSFVLKFLEFHNTQKTIMNSIWWGTSFASSIYYQNVLYLN